MKNVFILGSRGYSTNYGGWETLLHGLLDNWKNKDTNFFVFEIINLKIDQGIEIINGVTCIRIYVKSKSNLAMMIFDYKSTLYTLKYLKNNNLDNPIIYYLGMRIGPLVYFLRPFLKKYNTTLVENTAGLEWKRAKWNRLVNVYNYISAYFMAKSMDYLICDSKEMVNVYNRMIKTRRPIKKYISYGSYKFEGVSDQMPIKVKNYFKKFDIAKDGYYLVVNRFVPENSYELIIKEFLISKTSKDLILVTNINKEHKFYEKLKRKYDFIEDKRIKFVGTMYDKDILIYLRAYAFAFINGHTCGGTNPGLLEAMSITNLNLVRDVNFSRETAGRTVKYFTDEFGLLSNLIDTVEKMTQKEIDYYGMLAKERVHENYSWNFIVDEYENFFNKIIL